MKKFLLGILTGILVLCFTGCMAEKEEDNFCVVTSFYPLYISALNVTDGVEGVEVVNMAGQQTGCLHDYQL